MCLAVACPRSARKLDADTGRALFGSEAKRNFFAELGALEWALVEAIHAAPAPSFDAAAFQAIAPERLGDARLTESGSARLLRFEHPVNAFYQAVRVSSEGRDVPAPLASATVVYRLGLTVWRMDLTPAMSRVLGALLAGATIGESVARIGVDESDPDALAEAERSVMVWFREWVRAGFFSGVTIDERVRFSRWTSAPTTSPARIRRWWRHWLLPTRVRRAHTATTSGPPASRSDWQRCSSGRWPCFPSSREPRRTRSRSRS